MILLNIQDSLDSEESTAATNLGRTTKWIFFPWESNILKQRTFMTQLNILDMKPIKTIPLHFFGSNKSYGFGTGTHWLLCPLSRLDISCKKSLMKSNTYILQVLSVDLNASRGTTFNPAAFILLRSLNARFNYS